MYTLHVHPILLGWLIIKKKQQEGWGISNLKKVSSIPPQRKCVSLPVHLISVGGLFFFKKKEGWDFKFKKVSSIPPQGNIYPSTFSMYTRVINF